jgi:cupin 2 domain-containing protein
MNKKKSPGVKSPARVPAVNNLFALIPENLEKEYFEKLLKNEHFFLEKIVSEGQITPPDTWLCENTDEWVIVLSGSAKLSFKNDNSTVELQAGDYLTIPAGTHHRVEWTDPNTKTVWLALHYDSGIKD